MRISDWSSDVCSSDLDGGGFHHFHHEGGPALREIVRRADPAEQPVDNADAGAVGGNEAARLRQYRDQRVLAKEGRFAAHVGAGHQPQARGLLKAAIIGDRSEEHTSELQSLMRISYAAFCLKNNNTTIERHTES